MLKLKKIKLKKVKKFFQSLPKVLTENILLTFLGLLIISLILGFIIFYQSNVLITASIEIEEKPLEFNEETCQKVLKEWQERDKIFSEINLKEYPNPF